MNNNATVYVIDDNKPMTEALKWLLDEVNGLPVAVYDDARLFLQHYQENWHGCLLVDLLMPGMSGLELLQALKERNNIMPVIVLTGHADSHTATQALNAGAHSVLTKPFDTIELIEKVKKLLEKAS